MKGREQELATLNYEARALHVDMQKRACISKVLSGKHVMVIGGTGSGKTYYMAYIAKKYLQRFIFVNLQLEEIVDKITTVTYDEPDDLLDGLTDGERSIQFIPDEDDMVAIDQLAEIRRGLFEMAAEIGAKGNEFWLNMIIDEAQTYAWKGARTDLDNFARRGRRFGIRSWFLTQRPQNISSTITNNVQYQVIFRTGSYESVYFKQYKIPIAEHESWLMQDYHYCLWDGYEMTDCEPVEEVI